MKKYHAMAQLDRLARSVSHLLAVIEQLEANGAHFRSLRDPIVLTASAHAFSDGACTDAVFDGCNAVTHTHCQFRLR
jgi:DNA invertase Pin-like site-specific DNA recombinase